MPVCLGFDTSNYTTSIAVFDGETGCNVGKLLDVPEGSLGLRQSDALFQHVKRLPGLLEQLKNTGLLNSIAAVGASTQPRAVEGSYMPCFLPGENLGRSLALALNVPFFACSHQQGHLAAAAWSAKHLCLLDEPFLAWHLSGGTTELLYVRPEKGMPCAVCIGGSSDISAGQLIDRAGKYLGIPFPAGKGLDKLAAACDSAGKFSVKLKELTFSLSGVENKIKELVSVGTEPETVARFVLNTVADAVCRATKQAEERYPGLPVLFSGGVASNSVLRTVMRDGFFAAPEFSTDNAMGVAILTRRRLERGDAE